MSDVKEKASDLRAQLEERPKSRVDLLVGGVGAVAAAAIILIVARGLPAKTTAADPAPVSTIRPQQPPPALPPPPTPIEAKTAAAAPEDAAPSTASAPLRHARTHTPKPAKSASVATPPLPAAPTKPAAKPIDEPLPEFPVPKGT